MYAFYNKEKECYMFVDAGVGIVIHTDDTEVDYSFSECGDILYTSKDRSVLEFILSLRDATYDKSQCVWSGSFSKPYNHKILSGYEIVEIGRVIVPEEQFYIRYTEDNGYENITRDFIGNLEESKELIDNTIRTLYSNNLLRDIRVLEGVEKETVQYGLFDVMKFFMEK